MDLAEALRQQLLAPPPPSSIGELRRSLDVPRRQQNSTLAKRLLGIGRGTQPREMTADQRRAYKSTMRAFQGRRKPSESAQRQLGIQLGPAPRRVAGGRRGKAQVAIAGTFRIAKDSDYDREMRAPKNGYVRVDLARTADLLERGDDQGAARAFNDAFAAAYGMHGGTSIEVLDVEGLEIYD